jgi:glycerophosphoryl diester phosphodiesterase
MMIIVIHWSVCIVVAPHPDTPKNAIETFSYNASLQPVLVECDVRISKDSALILMHDNTLKPNNHKAEGL